MKKTVKLALVSVGEDEKEHGSGLPKQTIARVMKAISKTTNAPRRIASRRRSTSSPGTSPLGGKDEKNPDPTGRWSLEGAMNIYGCTGQPKQALCIFWLDKHIVIDMLTVAIMGDDLNL